MSEAGISDVHRQLCQILSPAVPASEIAPTATSAAPGESFWIIFTELANENLVTPAVWPALEKRKLTHWVPAEFQDYFRAAFEWNTERNNAIQCELVAAILALNEKEIVPVLLKGAAHISDRTFPEIGARILGDVDILVAAEQTDAAVQVFQSLGYFPAGRPGRDYDEHHHTEPLKNPRLQAYVEVHREAIAKPITDLLPASTIIRDSRLLGDSGARYAVPSPTHAATISFLHSQVIDGCDATARIDVRSLMDMVHLNHRYGSDIDWDDILRNMSSYGMSNQFRNYVYSMNRLAGFEMPAEIEVSLRQRLHFYLIGAALRFDWLSSMFTFLYELSERRISERYELDQPGDSVFFARIRHIVFVVKGIGRRDSGD